VKLWYSSLFDLTSFTVKKHHIVIFFEIQIWIVQIESDGEMTKIKSVHFDEFYTFGIRYVFI
jgi:hypothetical protein